MKWNNSKTEELFETILSLESLKEARMFFRDLLTENEIAEFGNRWKAVRMLDGGSSYSKITEETGLSSTTVARISKWLKSGMGGYGLMLKRIAENNHHMALPHPRKG